MLRIFRTKYSFLGLSFVLLFFLTSGSFRSEDIPKGNIIGFVYAKDGTTPLEGATVKVKNISTGAVYESSKSDDLGIFRIPGVERGVYIYGVEAANGDFNSIEPIGIRVRENETAKLSISINPYEGKVASAVQEIFEDQRITGEALVGRVVNYYPESRMAEVLITKGLLQRDDMIYVRGDGTDFYQDVEFLAQKGAPVENLFSGQSAVLGVKNQVKAGDLIYAIYKWGVLPFVSSPSGKASVIAGSSEIVYSSMEVDTLCYCPSPWWPPGWGWWLQHCTKNPGAEGCDKFWEWWCNWHPDHPLCPSNEDN
jgi:hypothetical protein